MRSVFMRLALRRMARKNPEYRADIKTILRDGDLLDAVTEAVSENAVYEGISKEAPILDWFKWLIEYVIEHPEEIMKIIQLILTLFMQEE